MGGSLSRSNNCENYKAKIAQLNKELNDFKSGRMSFSNAEDPYNEYQGGRKQIKRNKKTRKSRKR
jgi:hypothetical protein